MTLRNRLQAENALALYTRRHKRQTVTGALGNNAGTVEHATRLNWVYVRLHGDANQVILAYCGVSIPLVLNLVVTLERVERKASAFYQVLGIAENIIYVDNDAAGASGEHALQHQRRDRNEGGFDPLDIYTRALVNLRARAQAVPDLTVYVERGFYYITSVKLWSGGNSGAFTAPVAAGVWRFDLLYIDSADTLQITTGTEIAIWPGILPNYPVCPASAVPICYVLLQTGQTTITETDIDDARLVSGASLPASATSHNILSATHADSTAAAVVDGDIIIGNVTPRWSRLAISIPAANVRNVLGVDNGELRPSWKTILDGTTPKEIIAGASGTPGTALTAAHRDHEHGLRWLEPVVTESIWWEDVRISGAMTRVGATAPTLSAFGPSGSLKVLTFDEGQHDEVHFEIQMPHGWKAGTKIYPHVHWTPVTAEAGNVVWQLEYAWQNINGTFGAPSTLSSDATAAGGTAWYHHKTRLKDGSGNDYIDGAGINVSSMLVCRLHRDAGAGSDTLTEAVAFLEFDIHYQVDALGSENEASKSANTQMELLYYDNDIVMTQVV